MFACDTTRQSRRHLCRRDILTCWIFGKGCRELRVNLGDAILSVRCHVLTVICRICGAGKRLVFGWLVLQRTDMPHIAPGTRVLSKEVSGGSGKRLNVSRKIYVLQPHSLFHCREGVEMCLPWELQWYVIFRQYCQTYGIARWSIEGI